MRIGLFGGTFNPVHLGHLRAAEEIRELFNLDKVLFIPAHIAPHKQSGTLASSHHRLKMLEYALQQNRHFAVSDIEIRREGTSYSVDTLRALKRSLPEVGESFFMMGIDAFLEIESWKHYEDLFTLCNVIVMTRPGYAVPGPELLLPRRILSEFTFFQQDTHRYCHRGGTAVFIAHISALDISSCAIRGRIAEGRSIRYLVPEAVEAYLRDAYLYQRSGTTNGG